MQVMDLPPNLTQFPEHEHSESGQEEVYLVLRGRCELAVEGERIALDPDTIVRVGPNSKRTFYTGDQPARILALGGVPGAVYEASGHHEARRAGSAGPAALARAPGASPRRSPPRPRWPGPPWPARTASATRRPPGA